MGDESPRERLQAQAVRWLARREYSAHELGERLCARGFERADVAALVPELEANGLLSDRRFTESLVRNRIERGHGPQRITRELRTRGVDDTLIEEFVVADDDYWMACLRAVWEKRFGRPPANYRDWTRQARGLQRLGYNAAQVRRVVPDIDT